MRALRVAARAGVTKRGEGGKNTKPTQSAPDATAASNAASVVRPQIFTRTLVMWALRSRVGRGLVWFRSRMLRFNRHNDPSPNPLPQEEGREFSWPRPTHRAAP